MSEQTSPPDPAARPSASPSAHGPVGVRRSRAKPSVRAHPPVKRALRDYWVMFCERWYWGLIPALLVVGALVFQQLRHPHLFRSTATLQFAAKQDFDVARGGTAGAVNLGSYVEQLRSASFRDRVIATFTPEEIELIREPYRLPDEDASTSPDVVAILAGAVAIEPRTEVPIVAVVVTHREGAASEIITNRYLRSFIEFSADASETNLNSALLALHDEERKLRQRVDETEGRIKEFRKAHSSRTPADNESLVTQRLTAISDQLIEARRDRVQLEATLQIVDQAIQDQRDVTRLPYVAAFRGVAPLIAEIDALRSQRALLERKYLENHPAMKANQLELDAKIALLDRTADEAVGALRARHAQARRQEEQLAAEQNAAERERLAITESAGTLRLLEEQAAQARELYSQMEKRRSGLVMTRGLDNISVSILDRASSPQALIPDLKPTLIRGGAIGLALFLMVPVVFGLRDTRLKAAWEVEQFLKENLLGEMPSIEGVTRKERPHIMARDLDHGAAEAFRGLFGQLQLNSTVPYPKVLMLTSTLPGEGKSIVANNLAATFAGHGKRTLLIDCDFRRPNLHVYYGKDNACGLMRWLETSEDLTDLAIENEDLGILPLQENFYLLRAGGESRRATELFEMQGFARLLAGLRRQFDIVIIDTPPVGVFPDSMLLSRLVDEIAYVCRFNAVNRSKIRKCIERLRTPNAVFAGIVLNGIPSGKQSAHYDYYGYGANEAKRYKAYYSQRR